MKVFLLLLIAFCFASVTTSVSLSPQKTLWVVGQDDSDHLHYPKQYEKDPRLQPFKMILLSELMANPSVLKDYHNVIWENHGTANSQEGLPTPDSYSKKNNEYWGKTKSKVKVCSGTCAKYWYETVSGDFGYNYLQILRENMHKAGTRRNIMFMCKDIVGQLQSNKKIKLMNGKFVANLRAQKCDLSKGPADEFVYIDLGAYHQGNFLRQILENPETNSVNFDNQGPPTTIFVPDQKKSFIATSSSLRHNLRRRVKNPKKPGSTGSSSSGSSSSGSSSSGSSSSGPSSSGSSSSGSSSSGSSSSGSSSSGSSSSGSSSSGSSSSGSSSSGSSSSGSSSSGSSSSGSSSSDDSSTSSSSSDSTDDEDIPEKYKTPVKVHHRWMC